MRRFYTLYLFIGFVIALLGLESLASCGRSADCHAPIGTWVNREGTELIFSQSGAVLWLTRFGSQTDTQRCQFQLQCDNDPAGFELNEFSAGPFVGKQLLGIFEWSSDTAFRWQYDSGERPAAFAAEHSSTFYKATGE